MNIAELDTPKIDNYIDYRLRPMEPRDSKTYAELMATSPESGLVTVQVLFKEDAYEMLMRRRIGQIIVIAETPDGKVVGAASADARPVWFEGQPIQSVHLHGLLVHPNYRRHGVATALTKWRIKWAQENYGAGVLIFAEIETNNIAAFRNASKWATGFGQPRESGFLRVYKKEPVVANNVRIREAEEKDYSTIVQGLRDFNEDVNFTRYVTADRLHRNLEPIHGQIFRHRYVVEEDGQIVGGAVLSAHDPSVETRMIRAPFLNKMIARMAGMIGKDDILNGGEIDGIWYKPGHADAAHDMVQYLRYKASVDTDALNLTVLNPKAWEAVRISHWMPHTILSVAYLRPPTLKIYSEDEEQVPAAK